MPRFAEDRLGVSEVRDEGIVVAGEEDGVTEPVGVAAAQIGGVHVLRDAAAEVVAGIEQVLLASCPSAEFRRDDQRGRLRVVIGHELLHPQPADPPGPRRERPPQRVRQRRPVLGRPEGEGLVDVESIGFLAHAGT